MSKAFAQALNEPFCCTHTVLGARMRLYTDFSHLMMFFLTCQSVNKCSLDGIYIYIPLCAFFLMVLLTQQVNLGFSTQTRGTMTCREMENMREAYIFFGVTLRPILLSGKELRRGPLTTLPIRGC